MLLGDLLDQLGGVLRRQRGQDALARLGLEVQQRAEGLARPDRLYVGRQPLGIARARQRVELV